MFGRYHQDSIKGHTGRIVRASGVTRRFHLQLVTELPSQKVVLTVTQNKMQLTDLVLQSLQEYPIVSRQKLVLWWSQASMTLYRSTMGSSDGTSIVKDQS